MPSSHVASMTRCKLLAGALASAITPALARPVGADGQPFYDATVANA